MSQDEVASRARRDMKEKPGDAPHHLHRAEGKDLLEAAIIAVEKAAHWDNPKYYHEGAYKEAVQMAGLRATVALAVELRALRSVLEAHLGNK